MASLELSLPWVAREAARHFVNANPCGALPHPFRVTTRSGDQWFDVIASGRATYPPVLVRMPFDLSFRSDDGFDSVSVLIAEAMKPFIKPRDLFYGYLNMGAE